MPAAFVVSKNRGSGAGKPVGGLGGKRFGIDQVRDNTIADRESRGGGHDAYQICHEPDRTPAQLAADLSMRELQVPLETALGASIHAKLGLDAPRADSADAASASPSSTARSSDRTSAAKTADGSDQARSSASQSTPVSRSSVSAPSSDPSNFKNRTASSFGSVSRPAPPFINAGGQAGSHEGISRRRGT